MKRISAILSILPVVLLLLAGAVVFAAENEDLPVRAPDAVKGTSTAMLSPEFWIGKLDNPDHLMASLSEIQTLNEKNASRIIPADHPYRKNIDRIEQDGPLFNVIDPLEVPIDAAAVKARLEKNNERLAKGRFFDRWELPLTDEKKAEYFTLVNLTAIPASIDPEYGIIVRHCSARLYPVDEPAYRMRGYLDDNNVSSLDIGMPVAVVHRSLTGEYCFVLSPVAWGWVPARDIAFGSPSKIRRYRDAGDVVVAVCHRTPFYADRDMNRYMGHLYMGERVRFDKKIGGMCRLVVPVREEDGDLEFERAWIPTGDHISVGYLPFTQCNVIRTAFKLLGRPYGWHDSWGERDCGGIMRVIFNCFGFSLPRYWSFEQLCTDRAEYVGDMEDIEAKSDKLTSFPEGVTFTGTTGHIGLYLGAVEGVPFCIHQCGWNYSDDGMEYKMARTVVSDYINVGFTMKSLQFFSPLLP